MEPPHQRPTLPSPAELAKLPKDGGPAWNRLVFEKSPYLLQHAANPVDWYPWGDEAFDAARRLDRPIFLSIGYSTCHWCHVMEHESFEDAGIARLMNDAFVCVKVDREERPDVDNVYMTVTQALTGSGGWPMTIIMTPDKRPFYAGTYFPKQGGYGRPGMADLVPAVANAWKGDRAALLESADRVTSALSRMSGGTPGGSLDAKVLEQAYSELQGRFDPEHGGFGGAPKFPTPHQLSFLLRYWKRTGSEPARTMALTTLDGLRRGGVFDQVGFGLHRYSTDREWLVPHFEKMLYDQALLAIACLDAVQATGGGEPARTAREIFTYVLADLTSPEGGFYSAEDADSEGVEGKFYLWTPGEVRRILGKEAGDLFVQVFDVQEGGNFREQATGRKTGESILRLPSSLPATARALGLEEADLRARLEASRQALLRERRKRVPPGKDDKVLTDWNGLMIAALARGAQVLGDPSCATAAGRAADFILSAVRGRDGRLHKRWRGGEAGLPAMVDDYAFMIWGLVELYEATFETRWLQAALDLADVMTKHYWDEREGGFFVAPDDGEKLPVRGKEIYDGAVPSGNSVAVLDLIRLARITGRPGLEERAMAVVRAFSGGVLRGASSHAQLLQAVDFELGPSYEVVISGNPESADTQAMLAALRRPFLPNMVVVLRPPGAAATEIVRLAPYTAAQLMVDGKATAYVCRSHACSAPTTEPARMLQLLEPTAR